MKMKFAMHEMRFPLPLKASLELQLYYISNKVFNYLKFQDVAVDMINIIGIMYYLNHHQTLFPTAGHSSPLRERTA